jgi:hypothetical protein
MCLFLSHPKGPGDGGHKARSSKRLVFGLSCLSCSCASSYLACILCSPTTRRSRDCTMKFVLGSLSLLLAMVASQPVTNRDRVYTANQFSNTVSVIDPSSDELLGTWSWSVVVLLLVAVLLLVWVLGLNTFRSSLITSTLTLRHLTLRTNYRQEKSTTDREKEKER